jgi:hypothetical protein
MLRSFLLALMVCVLIVLGLAWRNGRIPPRFDPWAPLNVAEVPNWLTRYKLHRLDADAPRCLAALATSSVRHVPVADRSAGEGCGWHNAVRVTGTRFNLQPVVLSCPAAVSLALWETHVVVPAAQRHFNEPVVRLEHFGSYACRNVNGSEQGRRSRHAVADALDVAGFTLRSGRRITLARSWNAGGADGLFLRELHAGACRFFDGVLGPEYNAAHQDHFHLDRGPFTVCR